MSNSLTEKQFLTAKIIGFFVSTISATLLFIFYNNIVGFIHNHHIDPGKGGLLLLIIWVVSVSGMSIADLCYLFKRHTKIANILSVCSMPVIMAIILLLLNTNIVSWLVGLFVTMLYLCGITFLFITQSGMNLLTNFGEEN